MIVDVIVQFDAGTNMVMFPDGTTYYYMGSQPLRTAGQENQQAQAVESQTDKIIKLKGAGFKIDDMAKMKNEGLI